MYNIQIHFKEKLKRPIKSFLNDYEMMKSEIDLLSLEMVVTFQL